VIPVLEVVERPGLDGIGPKHRQENRHGERDQPFHELAEQGEHGDGPPHRIVC
jgi:hypothetical protein